MTSHIDATGMRSSWQPSMVWRRRTMRALVMLPSWSHLRLTISNFFQWCLFPKCWTLKKIRDCPKTCRIDVELPGWAEKAGGFIWVHCSGLCSHEAKRGGSGVGFGIWAQKPNLLDKSKYMMQCKGIGNEEKQMQLNTFQTSCWFK